MNKIYFDNAATSYPKAPGVSLAVCDYIDNIGANVGRGTYKSSYDAASIVYETRQLLAELFNFDNPLNVAFTMNITYSLNLLLLGLLKPGDHVVISSMEHNAVMRPLNYLKSKGITYDKVECNSIGQLDVTLVEKSLKENTRLVLITHASNVSGTIMPVEAIGELCLSKGIYFAIDTAQTAGSLPIDFKKFNLSALAFTGHKGLLGPQGIGGLMLSDELAALIPSLITGGTGSESESELQPQFMPDKFEAGTLNLPGIFGLNASLKFLTATTIDKIHSHEMELTQAFIDGISELKNIELIGPTMALPRTSVVSLNFKAMDNSDAAFLLDTKYNIMTRVGLHCSPSAHKSLSTYNSGTVRFSFGYFNTMEEISYCLNSLKKL